MSTSHSIDHVSTKKPPTRVDHRVEKPKSPLHRFFNKLAYRIVRLKRQAIIFVTPLLLLPIPLGIGTKASQGWYIFIIMIIYWITEVIPIGVTAFLPVVLAPMFRIIDAKHLTEYFASEELLQKFSVFAIGSIIERWDLHRRIILHATRYTGPNPRKLLLFYMFVANVLSYFTDATLSFVLVQPLLIALSIEHKKFLNLMMRTWPLAEVGTTITPRMRRERQERIQKTTELYTNFSKAFVIGIGYASNIASIYSINMNSFYDLVKEDVNQFGYKLHYMDWMIYNISVSVILILFAWVWLIVCLIGVREFFLSERKDIDTQMTDYFTSQFTGMPSINFAEGSALFFSATMTLLHLSYSLPLVKGWSAFFMKEGKPYVRRSSLMLVMLVLTFAWPVENPLKFCYRSLKNACTNLHTGRSFSSASSTTGIMSETFGLKMRKSSRAIVSSYLMEWSWFEMRYPWIAYMVVGCTLIHEEVSRKSHLPESIVGFLKFVKTDSSNILVVELIIIAGIMTEVFQSITVLRMMKNVIALVAECTDHRPAFLFLPTATCGWLPFIMPSAAPFLILIFKDNPDLKVLDLVKAGTVMKLFTIILLSFYAVAFQQYAFKFRDFPLGKNCEPRIIAE